MSFFSRFKPAPASAPSPNGLPNLPTANKALTNALHTVANVKLRNALKAAKNAANATGAEKNKKIAELEAALKEAKPVVTAANAAAPNNPVEPATQNAEAAAVSAVIRQAVANNNATITANVKWNNANKKWVKVNTSTLPEYNVKWNINRGKNNNKPILVKIQTPPANINNNVNLR
jgi:hypothetical protein